MRNEGTSKTIQKQQEKPKGKAQKQSVISDRKLIEFNWPPKFNYVPKKKKRYDHVVVIVTALHEHPLIFHNKPLAMTVRTYVRMAKNVLEVKYKAVEIPTITENGLIEQ